MYSIYLPQMSKKNKKEILHSSTMETSESYNDLESFKSYKKEVLVTIHGMSVQIFKTTLKPSPTLW